MVNVVIGKMHALVCGRKASTKALEMPPITILRPVFDFLSLSNFQYFSSLIVATTTDVGILILEQSITYLNEQLECHIGSFCCSAGEYLCSRIEMRDIPLVAL